MDSTNETTPPIKPSVVELHAPRQKRTEPGDDRPASAKLRYYTGRNPANPKEPPDWAPLNLERREVVSTECAAYHLGRAPATLRGWHAFGGGPDGLRPLNVGGRLLWRVADLRRLLQPEAAA